MFIGHTRKECPNLLSTEITIETDTKKRKADYELKTFSIRKKSKVGHFKEVVKQKVVTVNKEETLKLKKNKKLKTPQRIK